MKGGSQSCRHWGFRLLGRENSKSKGSEESGSGGRNRLVGKKKDQRNYIE